MILSKLNPYIGLIRIGAFVLAIVAMIGFGFWAGCKWKQSEVAVLNLSIAEQKAEVAKAVATASEAARREEVSRAEAVHYIAIAYEQGKSNAHVKAETVVADLRADNLRLRNHWRGCVSQAPAAAGQPDAGAELRTAGAGDLVRVVAACSEQVKGLQAVIASYRSRQ